MSSMIWRFLQVLAPTIPLVPTRTQVKTPAASSDLIGVVVGGNGLQSVFLVSMHV